MKKFLKKDSRIPIWDEKTKKSFEDSKKPIIEIMKTNLKIYDMKKQTIFMKDC